MAAMTAVILVLPFRGLVGWADVVPPADSGQALSEVEWILPMRVLRIGVGGTRLRLSEEMACGARSAGPRDLGRREE